MFKSCFVLRVSCHIALKFSVPVSDISDRRARSFTAGMPVPKTAMHKNGGMIFGQNYVRLTGKVLSLKPEPVTHEMQEGAHGPLWPCVASLHLGHYPASFFRVYLVHISRLQLNRVYFRQYILWANAYQERLTSFRKRTLSFFTLFCGENDNAFYRCCNYFE